MEDKGRKMGQVYEVECLRPQDIEKRSFEIISEELNERGIVLCKEQEMVTKRVIHTSADFDYAKTMMYSKDAVLIAKVKKRCAKVPSAMSFGCVGNVCSLCLYRLCHLAEL